MCVGAITVFNVKVCARLYWHGEKLNLFIWNTNLKSKAGSDCCFSPHQRARTAGRRAARHPPRLLPSSRERWPTSRDPSTFLLPKEEYLVPYLFLPSWDLDSFTLYLCLDHCEDTAGWNIKTHSAGLESWGSRSQTRIRVYGASRVRAAPEPVVAVSCVANSYHGPSKHGLLGSLTPPLSV